MLLKDILSKIQIEKVTGNTDIEIKDVQHYSPFVTEGSLFICIEGFKTDGQLYIEEQSRRYLMYGHISVSTGDFPTTRDPLYMRQNMKR
jgi:UDP-N-acetylmuramyl pentapeptide synthase